MKRAFNKTFDNEERMPLNTLRAVSDRPTTKRRKPNTNSGQRRRNPAFSTNQLLEAAEKTYPGTRPGTGKPSPSIDRNWYGKYLADLDWVSPEFLAEPWVKNDYMGLRKDPQWVTQTWNGWAEERFILEILEWASNVSSPPPPEQDSSYTDEPPTPEEAAAALEAEEADVADLWPRFTPRVAAKPPKSYAAALKMKATAEFGSRFGGNAWVLTKIHVKTDVLPAAGGPLRRPAEGRFLSRGTVRGR
ncbi:hypothetical protein CPLU01_04125 [Colletotrichum plurivorum]|uniref:Uncharacterized protein n=1 Tax=Colletotrichum plurivorum TaxID=2175906 RepID=A0A8H6NK84_9PEZI|nr:hypothetical protein CPLU01_04125 [Colletotrichum plurivorum]